MYKNLLSESINCVLMLVAFNNPSIEVIPLVLPIFIEDVFEPIYKGEISV